MSKVTEMMEEAGAEARRDSFNGMNRLRDALADWWLAEAQAHFHGSDGKIFHVYDMPGMEHSPAARAARAYLDGDGA